MFDWILNASVIAVLKLRVLLRIMEKEAFFDLYNMFLGIC